MLRWTSAIASFACCIAVAHAAADAPKKTSAAKKDRSITYQLMPEIPSAGLVRFVGRRPESWGISDALPIDFDTTQHVLVVFLEGAPARAQGVAYAMIERSVACPADTPSPLSFASYSAKGTLIARAATLPDYASNALDHRWLANDFATTCKRATTPVYPAVGFQPMSMSELDYQPTLRAKTPAEAMAAARRYVANVAAATSWAEEGRYVIGDVTPEVGLPVIDTSTLTARGGKKRVSWFLLARPFRDQSGYVRASHDVDCDAHTARPYLIGHFDGEGKLVKVFGAQDKDAALPPESPLGKFMNAACESAGPAASDTTYPTFSAALTAARERLAH